MDSDVYDITFVGTGPVALYGMYYAGLRLTRFKAIDMLDEVGGGLMALYPEKYIYDVAGFPKITAKELIKQLKEQAFQYPHDLCLGEKVVGLEREDDGLIRLVTSRGTHVSRTVIVCTGLGAYIPKKLDIPNVEKLEGAGVFYSVRQPSEFRDKNILIVGGGDAAFDYAMMLEPVAGSITHIHRNDFFSAHEDSVRRVSESSVNLLYPFWEVERIEGEEWVSRVTIVNSRSGEEKVLPVDAVIFNIGFLTNLGPVAEWGLRLHRNAIEVDSRMSTNIPGVYAAGDIVTYDGKLKLISTGFGEVAMAVNNAKHYIDPKAKVSPGHSTDKHPIARAKAARAAQAQRQVAPPTPKEPD